MDPRWDVFRPIARATVSIIIDCYGYMYNVFVNNNNNYPISTRRTMFTA